jgi:hypothetical protein
MKKLLIGFKSNAPKKIRFKPINDGVYSNVLPPTNAASIVPEWFKKMEKFIGKSNKPMTPDGQNNMTMKMCSPVIDSMTMGYFIRLSCDVMVSNDLSYAKFTAHVPWAVVGQHNQNQIGEYPVPESFESASYIWQGQWGVETPAGYSALYIHPVNRHDLPFYTMTGVIDSDMFSKAVSLPFFIKKGFEGIIPEGTPIAQVIPIKRDQWVSEKSKYDVSTEIQNISLVKKIMRGYKTLYWQKKNYT